MYNKWKSLRSKSDIHSVNEAQKIEAKIVECYGDSMENKINKEISGLQTEEGGLNVGHLWRLKNKKKCQNIWTHPQPFSMQMEN